MTRPRLRLTSGSAFEHQIGYARTVVDADWVFVSGCSGYDYETMSLPDGVVPQAEQAMRNVESALRGAGASITDVVRVRYFLPDRADFPACWPVLRHWFAASPPAATMIVCGLLEAEMRIEIEVTARMTPRDPRRGERCET